MLAKQGVDIEGGAHILGWIDGADLDIGALVGGEHLLQIVAGDRIGLAARDRVRGDAALEVDQFAGSAVLVALPEKVDLGSDMASFGVGDLQLADIGKEPAIAGADLDLAADLAGHGDARVLVGGELGQAAADDFDAGPAAADLDDMPDRLVARDERRARRGRDGARLRRLIARREIVEIHRVGHRAPSTRGTGV